MKYKKFIFLFFVFFSHSVFAEENFLLINGSTNETIVEMGSSIDERMSPCSTFKIVLSLMGYDAGILKDESTPVWHFQKGYDEFLDVWKNPQTPQAWMNTSCVWYSRVLALKLDAQPIQNCLAVFHYGNQDISGGLAQFWINSSLKISLREQVDFLRKMKTLPLAQQAIQNTKKILFKEDLPNGYKLYGKTGWSGSKTELQLGWFVGWIEKDDHIFPFAYNILEPKIKLDQRIPRVKQLLEEAMQFSSSKDILIISNVVAKPLEKQNMIKAEEKDGLSEYRSKVGSLYKTALSPDFLNFLEKKLNAKVLYCKPYEYEIETKRQVIGSVAGLHLLVIKKE